jgi:hypothetical protein
LEGKIENMLKHDFFKIIILEVQMNTRMRSFSTLFTRTRNAQLKHGWSARYLSYYVQKVRAVERWKQHDDQLRVRFVKKAEFSVRAE